MLSYCHSTISSLGIVPSSRMSPEDGDSDVTEVKIEAKFLTFHLSVEDLGFREEMEEMCESIFRPRLRTDL